MNDEALLVVQRPPTVDKIEKISVTIYEAALECVAQASWETSGDRHRVPVQPRALLGIAAHSIFEQALVHIQRAMEGQWENRSTTALGLAHAVDTDPLGRWEVHRESTAGHMLCVWRAPNGEPTWRAVMENERRTRSMLAQADLEHHPAMRPKPTTDSTGQQTCREQARSDKTRAVARDRLQLKDRLKRSFNADRDRPRENRTPWT